MDKLEYLSLIDKVIENGEYKDNWQSLTNHNTPKWFMNDKFGIFIHWGIYSVPAFSDECYSRHMYDPERKEYKYHREHFGDQKDFGYKDFIKDFDGKNFCADKWAELFESAGARYVVPVAEHHDGFAMYDTAFNRWNASKMGPKRDVVGLLKEACEKRGLTFCASTHRAEHYFFMNMGRTFESDVNDPEYEDFYGPAVYCDQWHSNDVHKTTADTYSKGASRQWLEDWLVRTCELIDKYRPKIVYFDWWIHNHSFKPYLKKLAAYYYNRALEWGEEVTIEYKHEAFPKGAATIDVERGALTGISPIPWQTDTAIGKRSWGYTKDNEFKTAKQIVCDLVDIVSKNGNLLLNIGPKPDGTITDEETKVLLDIGKWMKINGEGIYGTTFWREFGEGEINAKEGFFMDNEEKGFTSKDVRFTYKNGYIYAFQMRPSKEIEIKSLRKLERHDILIEEITLLGSDEKIEYIRDTDSLKIKLASVPITDMPICFRIKMG